MDSTIYEERSTRTWELKPNENGRHFAYNIFKCILLNVACIDLDNGSASNRGDTIT